MGEENRGAHATRGGAREARRAARAQRKAVKLPYIRRKLPVIDLLSQEALNSGAIQNHCACGAGPEQTFRESVCAFRGAWPGPC